MSNQARSAHEQELLRGFSHSMNELQWLLLILVLLYFFVPIHPIQNSDALILTMASFAGFVLLFGYLPFQRAEARWKLIVENCSMVAFITLALWYTGKSASPLLNLYLLAIIACAITLGRRMTMLEVALIAACYLGMGYADFGLDVLTAGTFTKLMANFSPFLLVAYVTSLLAADLHRANRKISVLSQTDALTGLFNMRAFTDLLEQEIALAERYSYFFSVIMIDVDRLKHVNDHFGHTVGTRLLRTVAESIHACTRASDVLARYGGDEFIILLPHTRSEAARLAAERVCAAVRRTSFEMNGRTVAVTTSIGVAGYPDSVATAADILDKADVALYESKHSGRDRVTVYRRDIERVRHFPDPHSPAAPGSRLSTPAISAPAQNCADAAR